MLQFLIPLICVVLVLLAYNHFSRANRSAGECSSASEQILISTSTNNTYPPLGKIFSTVGAETKDTLGEELHPDMTGFMKYDQNQ